MFSFKRFSRTALAAAALAGGWPEAHAQGQPPQDPMLRIDPGMHTAPIKRIGVDTSCTLLATGSEDKTIRLWRLPEGRLLRVLRPPIGPGNEGKVYALALAPDGSWVAAGGWDAAYAVERVNYVYIFDTATGRLVRRLGSLANVINHLAISSDGRHLAATLHSGEGVRVWDTGTWRQLAEDKNYNGRTSYGAAFDRQGTLYTVADDGRLRRYAPGYRDKPASVATRGGREPISVAVHPAGDRLAVGYDDTTAVDVYDARTLAHRFAADTAGVDNGDLSKVAWTTDGTRLYAGGRYQKHYTHGWRNTIRIWDGAGQGAAREVDASFNNIMQFLNCGNGLAMAATDPSFGLLTSDGRRQLWQGSVQADLRNKLAEHFLVSEDGRRVRFGLKPRSDEPVLFDLGAERLEDSAVAPQDLYPPDIESLSLSDWKDKFSPRLAGNPLQLERHESSRSVAIAPDVGRFVLGADWSLRAYTRDGKELWPRKQVPGVTWGVNIARNGRLIVAAYGDGTIRWYRLDDGRELLALFVHAKDRRWVAWTPKGYYTASPGAEDLIGWHVNRSWTETADFFPAARFRQTFSRPDVVARILDTLDENRAVELANAESQRRRDDDAVRRRLPPVIDILSPGDGGTFDGGSIAVRYTVRSPSGAAVTRVRVLIDGRPVESATRGLARVEQGGAQVGEQALTLDVAVPARNVTLTLLAETDHAVSAPAQVALRWAAATSAAPVTAARLAARPAHEKPKLYALLVGVSAYANPDLRLGYAAKDARDMAATLQHQAGGLYREVVVRLLTDRDATAEAIRTGLGWLEKEVTGRDMGLVFLAGHGVTDLKQRFFFLPVGADPENLLGTAVSKSDLQDSVTALAGKALVFIDACHSGRGIETTRFVKRSGSAAADITLLVNELSSAESGAVMFAASTGRELSVEDARWQNGAFTKALVEGFAGKADYSKDGAITVKELDLWVSERVKELTGKQQHPVSRMPGTMPDFPIAIVR
ncbi:MAG: caspase family protein [Hyphomicrobiaceae bacterium]